jgi:polar amino acid transport system substrate-binding protein
MKVKIAYIDEPPFYWTGSDKKVTGADIELAEVVLRAIGATSIEYCHTSFDKLLPGLEQNLWDMNVPIFVIAERARRVTFSDPVWALGDGFLVQKSNPKSLTSYEAVVSRSDARLGMVKGTKQFDTAKSAGVSEGQIVVFNDQPSAVGALQSGAIDAYAATSVGNRFLSNANQQLETISIERAAGETMPVGAFSFNKNNEKLVQAVNGQLRKYLGSNDHLARMAKYGITKFEINAVMSGRM